MTKDSTFFEKLALLSLAAMAIVALSAIAIIALRAGTVDPNASALIGVIVTGLIAVGKDIVAAVRSYAMSAQLGKVTDQLAASGPVVDAMPTPPDARAAAQVVADAAQDRADVIAADAIKTPEPSPAPSDPPSSLQPDRLADDAADDQAKA